jgi:hypothetical protein
MTDAPTTAAPGLGWPLAAARTSPTGLGWPDPAPEQGAPTSQETGS